MTGKHPWQVQADATRDTSISRDKAERILDEWYTRYRRAGRIDEDVFLALRHRLIPLVQGEPVQFLPMLRYGDVDPAKRRWLNGTYDGPADNPDDPDRSGDVWVIATSRSWPTGLSRRVPVFLSSVRRHTGKGTRNEP